MSIEIPPGSGYVAMGSSFGAGAGLRPRVAGSPRRAGRSTINYPHLVAEAAGLSLTDVTYSGAITADFLGPSKSGTPAQLDAVEQTTRLVTITGGGNDVGYLGVLTVPSLPWPVRILPAVRRQLAAWNEPATMDARFDSLHLSLASLVTAIRARSPEAVVVIVDYLTILPSDDSLVTGRPDAATARRARDIARRLSETFHSVAGEYGCEFLAVGEASRTHHAWAAEPWTQRFRYSQRDGVAYHPNAAGMRAVARMLEDLLGIRSA